MSSSGSQPEPRGQDSLGRFLFRQGPAWVTAIAGALAVLGIGFGAGYGTSKAQNSAPAPAVTVTVEPSNATTGPGNSTAPPATTNSYVYWSGPVEFSQSSGLGLDFDTSPPSTDQTTIIYEGNGLQSTANARVSLWNQPGTPSASQCRTWVTTHPNTDVTFPAVGMQICIKTDQGRYGLLHIDSSSNNDHLGVTATIWSS